MCARRSCIPGRRRPAMGWSLPAEAIGPALEDWAKWGQARHDYFLRAADLARAIAFVAETPRGGFIANMELQPEAPLADGTEERQQAQTGTRGDAVMTTAIVPRVSGGEEEHGHLEEFRTDPIGLMKRVRDECGDVGWFQLVDKHVILLSGAEANEFFFRSSRRRSRPGRGVPVHDADLRRGRGVRRQPRAAQGDAAQLRAARRADEGPRRHHRGRGQAG